MSKGKAYCPECRADTPVRVQPIFEGFEKVGEQRTCTFCGHAVQDGVKPETPPTSIASKTVTDLFGEPYSPPKSVNILANVGMMKMSMNAVAPRATQSTTAG